MKTLVFLSGNDESLNLLKNIEKFEQVEVAGVVCNSQMAYVSRFASKNAIPIFRKVEDAPQGYFELMIDARGIEESKKEIARVEPLIPLIPCQVVHWVVALMEEKENLIHQLKQHSDFQSLIFNLTFDGMIAVDSDGRVTLINASAEKVMGLTADSTIGKPVEDVIPSTQLPRVLRTLVPEINQELDLENSRKIITTRLPIKGKNGRLLGAFAVFKDITEIEKMAEEVTNLESIREMLNAIIQSSDDAISVVDEKGNGLLVNSAYTRLTGLKEVDVIGKPASVDITEGESMHMKVLKTRKPVRGAQMKVGMFKKEVIVNVAPLIVGGKLKGSVAVLHDVSEISVLTDQLNRARQIIRTLEAKYSFEDIVAHSEDMKLVIEQAKVAASTPITVLLRGESGTGKELFAHAIHNASPRRYNKFIRVNCAAISEHLLESELFGYEEGAFSGAKKGGKRGYFEEANGGSLFLDEIGEVSKPIQAKLLRVLQEKEIVRVGGTKPITIDVRVIAATNVNIEERILEGNFRQDLYYRLNRMPIFIPPLRQRKDDIEELCQRLINKINSDFGRHIESIEPAAMDFLTHYDWPGNVRELENVLGRAVIRMSVQESVIPIDAFSPFPQSHNQDAKRNETIHLSPSTEGLNEQLKRAEAELIRQALLDHSGNRTQTAKALKISVRNLYYKMEKYELETLL